jgi:hypothetical protein
LAYFIVGDDRGALGAALEPDEAVRAAAYVQHFEDEADIGEAA